MNKKSITLDISTHEELEKLKIEKKATNYDQLMRLILKENNLKRKSSLENKDIEKQLRIMNKSISIVLFIVCWMGDSILKQKSSVRENFEDYNSYKLAEEKYNNRKAKNKKNYNESMMIHNNVD